MNQLTFIYNDNSGNETDTNESIMLTKDVPEDMDIWTFHRLCKLFALSMTYPEKVVEEVFGPDNWQ